MIPRTSLRTPPGTLAALAAAALVLAACSTGTSSSSSSSSTASGTSAGAASLTDLQAAYVAVVKAVTPSVVEIATSGGLGSGVVFDGQGDIVTNSHVVGQATDVKITAADGKQHPGLVVGSFPPDDIAVVRVSQHDLKPLAFADSSKVQPGELAFAVGNPLGLQSSVTNGIVSATGRVVSEGPDVTLPDAIQTSAAINPGNSGGALVDLGSKLIGIPTLAALTPGAQGGQAPGISFAISSNRALALATQIARDGKVINSQRAYLGIQAANTTAGGVLVEAVTPNGPAAAAGIKAGDIITSVASKPTPTTAELSQVLATVQPGQVVPVNLTGADGARRTVSVRLGEFPGT